LRRRAGRQPGLSLAGPFVVEPIADHGPLDLHQEPFTLRVPSVESLAVDPGTVPSVNPDRIVPPGLAQRTTTVVHKPLSARQGVVLTLRWPPFRRRVHDRPLLALSAGYPVRLPDEQAFAVQARLVNSECLL